MPRSPGKSVFLLAVASVLALLVGLVGSGERPPATRRAPAPAPAEPWRHERSRVVLAPPRALPAGEHGPGASPPAPEPKTARAAQERLTGVVLRPEGQPAAGARVVLGQQHGRCDAEGRFELVLSGGSSGDLVAFEPGHEPAVRPSFGATLAAGGDHKVRLVLGPPTLTLSGVVAAANGQPLKGWTVELDGRDLLADFGLRESVRSGPDGQFVVSDVPAGVHVLRAWKERRDLAWRSPPTSAGESGIAIVVFE